MSKFTHFGYQEVPWSEKAKKVEAVFANVAQNYDLMNDLMSLGMHRLWKAHFIRKVHVKPHQTILDLAGGTGDIAVALAKKLAGTGHVILSDVNHAMLAEGKQKIADKYFLKNLSFSEIDAEQIPLADNSLDRVTISFGLRNVTDKPAALKEMYRVLRPGGKAMILEFSKPSHGLLDKLYDTYSFSVIPVLGDFIAKDKASYQYLVESIRKHPDQPTLCKLMTSAGFDEARYENLTGGIVAIHEGFKY